jgi:chromosome segregation ATPase
MSDHRTEELFQAMEAQQTMSEWERQIKELPELRRQVEQERQVNDALQKQQWARARIAKAISQAVPVMEEYHERLTKVKDEVNELAGMADGVAHLLTPAFGAFAASIAKEVIAQTKDITDPRGRAAVHFNVEEAIANALESLDPLPEVLSPFSGDAEISRLVNAAIVPNMKREAFNPHRPISSNTPLR